MRPGYLVTQSKTLGSWPGWMSENLKNRHVPQVWTVRNLLKVFVLRWLDQKQLAAVLHSDHQVVLLPVEKIHNQRLLLSFYFLHLCSLTGREPLLVFSLLIISQRQSALIKTAAIWNIKIVESIMKFFRIWNFWGVFCVFFFCWKRVNLSVVRCSAPPAGTRQPGEDDILFHDDVHCQSDAEVVIVTVFTPCFQQFCKN